MDFLSKQLSSLSIKMMAYVLSVVLLIFGISGYFELKMAYRTAVKDAHQQADDAITAAANAIQWRLFCVETTTHTAGRLGSMIGSNTYDVYNYLKGIVESNPDIASAGLFIKPGLYPGHKGMFAPAVSRNMDTKEIVMADVSDAEHGFNYLEDDENWEAALKGDSIWSDPYIDSTFTNRPLVTYSIPLYDNNGDFIAALYTEIDLHWLWMLLNDLKPTPESQISAIDADGNFLCHQDSSLILTTNALQLAKSSNDTTVFSITKKMMRGERGMDSITKDIQTESAGAKDNIEASYVYYAPIERTGWSITFTYPSKKVLSIPREMFHNMLKLGGITILLLIIIIAFGIHHIARPFAENLQKVSESKAGMESELRIASRIQMGMIPKLYPAFPDRHDIDVYGFLKPAKSVGGDLYDYFIREGKFFFCIGDVSGKGVPASLFMAVIRALFRNITLHVSDPALVITALNNALSEGNDMNMFCTMFLGVLDLKTGKLEYCNAGHNAPIIRRIKDNPEEVNVHYAKIDINIAVGVFEGFPYAKGETTLKPGEAIFLYTDGVTEAENVNKELFGDDATLATLADAREHHIRSAKDFVEYVYDVVHKYAEGTEQSDDITMLVVEYKGNDEKA